MIKLFTAGLGLLFAAIIMTLAAPGFFAGWINLIPAHSFIQALLELSPTTNNATSIGMVPVVIFTLASTGLGLLLATLFFCGAHVLLHTLALAARQAGMGAVRVLSSNAPAPGSKGASVRSDD